MKFVNRNLCRVLSILSLLFFLNLFANSSLGQNVIVGITAKNSGIVKVGDVIMVELFFHNSLSRFGNILPYKLRPQISIDQRFLQFDNSRHQLPDGWSILSNDSQNLWLSNGTDSIPSNTNRTVYLALKAIKPIDKNNVTMNLFFSNGKPPGNIPGPKLEGDLDTDNFSLIKISVKK